MKAAQVSIRKAKVERESNNRLSIVTKWGGIDSKGSVSLKKVGDSTNNKVKVLQNLRNEG